MADLLDIAPATAVETVMIDSHAIEVRGLHGNDIASIASRFPNLIVLIAGGLDVQRLIGQFGGALGPIIAAGCGHLADEKYEQHANTLLVEDQVRLVHAIYRLTFPNGMAQLVAAMTSLADGPESEARKVIKVRLKSSQSASPPSSGAASPQPMQ